MAVDITFQYIMSYTPCRSRYKRRCDTEPWTRSWYELHQLVAELPVRLRSPKAYWVPRPPRLTDFKKKKTHNHNQRRFFYIPNNYQNERGNNKRSTFACNHLTLCSHGWFQNQRKSIEDSSENPKRVSEK